MFPSAPQHAACDMMSLMTPKVRRVVEAVFWFVVGHLSCAVLHHLHDVAWK
jgi:hypothetical protein